MDKVYFVNIDIVGKCICLFMARVENLLICQLARSEVGKMDVSIKKIIRKLKGVSIVVIVCVVLLLFECI